MSSKKRILVLHGAINEPASKDEIDTIIEAETVCSSLKRLGYDIKTGVVDLDLKSFRNRLYEQKPDLVFNLVEAISGVGKYIHFPPLVLDELKIPYTGCSAQSIATTNSKILTKKLLTMANIPTPDWVMASTAKVKPDLSPIPCILKHVYEHASYGISDNSLFYSSKQLINRLNTIDHSEIDDYFVEQYIDGREFNLSIISTKNGTKVLPPAEILFNEFGKKAKIVGYAAKWDENSFEYKNTPRTFTFPDDDMLLLSELTTLTIKTWDTFDLKGYARVDFRVSANNEPFVLEVNGNPCISKDAGFAAAAERAGYDYDTLIGEIVKNAFVQTVSK